MGRKQEEGSLRVNQSSIKNDTDDWKCKTRENSIFSKKGKIVISVKIRNLFSRVQMTKRISSLELSREI